MEESEPCEKEKDALSSENEELKGDVADCKKKNGELLEEIEELKEEIEELKNPPKGFNNRRSFVRINTKISLADRYTCMQYPTYIYLNYYTHYFCK